MDIGKIFREISVHPDDRYLLRYIIWNEQQLEDWSMSCVTFGVTSSPFLATASLRQVAIDHADQHFTAGLVPVNFYFDDFLHRAANVAEALAKLLLTMQISTLQPALSQ